jgi:hypothetical protein
MKVWVARRRSLGVAVPPNYILGVGGPDLPMELVVKNVTDQGSRRPGKVARLYASGGSIAVAELQQPTLVWMKETCFVINGTERLPNSYDQKVGFSQSWLCQLSPPLSNYPLRILETLKEGIAVPGARLRDKVFKGWPGSVEVQFEMVSQLGRHSKVARFNSGGRSSPLLLLDVELEWMTEDRYELSGTTVTPSRDDREETHFAGGWLCRYWAPEYQEPSRGKEQSHGAE